LSRARKRLAEREAEQTAAAQRVLEKSHGLDASV
jgi:hypothetical protein